MSQKTKIEWTEATWNPVSGCTKVSTGCANCYAETMANRLKAMGTKGYENGFAVTLHPDRIGEPLRRKKPTMYFVCSMGDLFHEDVPFEFIDKIWAVMAAASRHTFQILTKRPERMREYLDTTRPLLPNVWLGVTAENQEQADKRIPILLDTPAVVRFVSIEPMLGEMDLSEYLNEQCGLCGSRNFGASYTKDDEYFCNECDMTHKYSLLVKLDWVIVGGETGAGARPLQYEWVKSIQEQCETAKVPFFFKKWGKTAYYKGQKLTNARVSDGMIDGVECRQMPEVIV